MKSLPRLSLYRVLLIAISCCGPGLASPQRPNVVLIMADDLGYGDVRANNPASKVPTPAVDRLAEEGMRFTDAHSPSAVCTPTRYGLLTGRYCWRSKLKRGVLFGYSPPLIEPGRKTIGHVFSEAGYRTACIGKWHLGMNMPGGEKDMDWSAKIENGPITRGFHHYFGVSASLDMPPYVWIEDDRFTKPATEKSPKREFPDYMRAGPIAPGFDAQDGLDTIARKGGEWIKKQAKAKKPFFLYLPLTAPHKPVLAAERFIGKSKLGPYGDFVMATDDALGQVLKALDECGAADNTLLVMTSDNGSFMYRLDHPTSPTKPGEGGKDHVSDDTIQGYFSKHHTANAELRGTKADVWEGGHRVPYFVRWPGVTPAGRSCDEPICHVDLWATYADMLGRELPDDAAEDSHSLLALFKGKKLDKPRGGVVHHSANGTFAIRRGKWKLILGSGSGGRGIPKSKPFDGRVQLYDMEASLSETENLADAKPEIVKELTALLEKYRESGRSR
jgi:arylsulfatase A-like enzyme